MSPRVSEDSAGQMKTDWTGKCSPGAALKSPRAEQQIFGESQILRRGKGNTALVFNFQVSNGSKRLEQQFSHL